MHVVHTEVRDTLVQAEDSVAGCQMCKIVQFRFNNWSVVDLAGVGEGLPYSCSVQTSWVRKNIERHMQNLCKSISGEAI